MTSTPTLRRLTPVKRPSRLAAPLALALLCAAGPARASDKSDAEGLVSDAKATIETLAKDPDYAAMRSALAQAKAVLIFPKVLRAGFVLGGSGGTGVLLARDSATGQWAGPAFYTVASASLGLQAGVSSAEVVMVVNSQKALDSLHTNKLKLGADASAALGSKGVERGAALNTTLKADFVVYSKVRGAFAGVSVDGSVLDVRQTLNSAYYGRATTPIEILIKRSVSNPAASALQAAVAEAAR